MIVSSLKEQYKHVSSRRSNTTLTSHQLTTQSTFNGSISAPTAIPAIPAIPAIRMDEVAIKMDTEVTEGLVDDPSERHNGITVPNNEAQFL